MAGGHIRRRWLRTALALRCCVTINSALICSAYFREHRPPQAHSDASFDVAVWIWQAVRIVNAGDPKPNCQILERRTFPSAAEADYLAKRAEIRCSVLLDAPCGKINEKVFVTMRTDQDIDPIEFPVRGDIVGTEAVMPEQIFLGMVQPCSQIKGAGVTAGSRAATGRPQAGDNGHVGQRILLRAPDKPGIFAGRL